MGAVDPTYPLFPVACVLATVMLFLVLLNSFIRQSWNLGVAFLCFWLSLENLTYGVNAVLWSDNAEVKLYVYCDIGASSRPCLESSRFTQSRAVSHLQLVTYVVRPMATLLITRRLYLIASLQSLDLPSAASVRTVRRAISQ